jgi:hypothetical protein
MRSLWPEPLMSCKPAGRGGRPGPGHVRLVRRQGLDRPPGHHGARRRAPVRPRHHPAPGMAAVPPTTSARRTTASSGRGSLRSTARCGHGRTSSSWPSSTTRARSSPRCTTGRMAGPLAPAPGRAAASARSRSPGPRCTPSNQTVYVRLPNTSRPPPTGFRAMEPDIGRPALPTSLNGGRLIRREPNPPARCYFAISLQGRSAARG